MKKHLTHKEWVHAQKLKNNLRDVLIQISLIESAVIKESQEIKPLSEHEKKYYRSLGNAIQILDKINLIDIFDLKEIRNQLVHDIFIKELDQDRIEAIRNKAFSLICKIRKESSLIKKRISSRPVGMIK